MTSVFRRTILAAIALLSFAAAAVAQQPQTSTEPLQDENAKFVQGMGIGYWPTAGSGLTLNIAAGTVNCAATMTTYAGGTLTMTASMTNYVYLNTSSSCAPASKTTAFTTADIPIATVAASGSAITTITDNRVQFTILVDPEVHIVPFANSVAGVNGGGPNTPASGGFTAASPGTNSLKGSYQGIPSTGAYLTFTLELPRDWDTSIQPYINVFWGSGANTTGTMIWTASSACIDVSTNGNASDDPSFNAESSFTTETAASANKEWYVGGEFTAMTSGNGCKALSPVIIKLAISGTAGSTINAYQAVVTIPRLPVPGAN